MRIAIVSDIHGNRTAFEAVLADLRETSPDLILHGGDLADAGASPVEIVDRIRDLGWQGVVGNTDEMLFRPESLREFASQSPKLQPLFAAIEEMAVATREALGEERLAWLRGLPRLQMHGPLALVHASPESRWGGDAPAGGGERNAPPSAARAPPPLFRCMVRWRSCTPVPRVAGGRPRRKRAMPSWSRSTRRSASRLPSMGTSIDRIFGAFQE